VIETLSERETSFSNAVSGLDFACVAGFKSA